MVEMMRRIDLAAKYKMSPATITSYKNEMGESGLFDDSCIWSGHHYLFIDEAAFGYWLQVRQKYRLGKPVKKYIRR